MTYIPGALRRLVYERAEARCEYCLLHEDDAYLPHEVELVYAEKHGGDAVFANLCLCCAICSRSKGVHLALLDMQSSELAHLFNPRLDRWGDHFRFDGALLEPLTSKGSVTVTLLDLNAYERLLERGALLKLGRLSALGQSDS